MSSPDAANWEIVEGPPKTKAGNRWIPLVNTELGETFSNLRAAQQTALVRPFHRYVFYDAASEPWHPKTLGREIGRVIADCPPAPKLTARGFRHTYATILLSV